MGLEFDKFDEWERWVPSIQGQREEAKTSPDTAASMELRYMTRVERKRFLRLAAKVSAGVMDDADHDKALRDILNSHVRNVRNINAAGSPVTEGGQLLNTDDDSLIYEVTQALRERSTLEAGLAKKLYPPSDS